MPEKLVSIVILACGKSRFTRLTLDGLLESTWPRVEVLLVDNGSSDDTREAFGEFRAKAEARDWQVKTILNDENVGAIEGRNQALRELSGDYVVFIDNDVVVGVRSWLEKLTAKLDSDPSIGILGPKILFASPPHDIQHAGCVVGRGGRVGFMGRGEPCDAPEFNHEREVQCLISACWIMPRRVVDRLGELDNLFYPVQFEDIDYCYRAKEAGYRCVYDPEVFVYHFENVTTDGTSGINYRYVTVKNGVKFKRKWEHLFSKEGGPDDASIPWKDIPRVPIENIGVLKIND